MKIKILHIVDVYLPRTMNWLDYLWRSTEHEIEHIVYPHFNILANNSRVPNNKYYIQRTDYPIPFVGKIINKLLFNYKKSQIFSIIRQEKIDAVHFHFGNVACRYLSEMEAWSKPVFISLYGYDYEHLPFTNPKIRDAYQLMAERGHQFIVEGNYSLSLLQSYKIKKEQISIVHLLMYKLYPNQFIKFKKPIRLIQVATYTPKKGQNMLLQALNTLKSGIFEVHFFGEIVDHNYYASLQELREKNNWNTIHFSGLIGEEEYLKKVSEAHIVVNLSQTTIDKDTEGGAPLFIKEGMLMGKPVLATKHADIPETVVHGFNGWLANEHNLEDIVTCLQGIQSMSEKKYIEFCNNAFFSLRSNGMANISGKELLKIYKEKI